MFLWIGWHLTPMFTCGKMGDMLPDFHLWLLRSLNDAGEVICQMYALAKCCGPDRATSDSQGKSGLSERSHVIPPGILRPRSALGLELLHEAWAHVRCMHVVCIYMHDCICVHIWLLLFVAICCYLLLFGAIWCYLVLFVAIHHPYLLLFVAICRYLQAN